METACGLFSTVAALMAPCSVKAMGKVVTMCEQLQPFLCAKSKDESHGKRSAFRLTAWFKVFVGTLYNAARLASITTSWVRIARSWI